MQYFFGSWLLFFQHELYCLQIFASLVGQSLCLISTFEALKKYQNDLHCWRTTSKDWLKQLKAWKDTKIFKLTNKMDNMIEWRSSQESLELPRIQEEWECCRK